MTDVLILTPDPADPDFGDLWREQGAGLRTALATLGVVADFAPWTSPVAAGPLVMPLLAWGYHRHGTRWLAALDRWEEAGVALANPAEMLRWNSDKRYLVDFSRRGAPVVPTRVFARLDDRAVREARAAFATDTLVAKPVVSAGAYGTVRLLANAPVPPSAGPMLLQPLMPAINSEGELSLFYFGGQYSHGVVKTPRLGDFRVQWQHGGSYAPLAPPAEAYAAAEAVLALIGRTAIYARVDLVSDERGGYLLMEIELIEPDLYLEHVPEAAAHFTRAVADRVNTL